MFEFYGYWVDFLIFNLGRSDKNSDLEVLYSLLFSKEKLELLEFISVPLGG